MAHFAQVENNKVVNVVVVANEDMLNIDGNESEEIGIAFLNNIIASNWIQTSYNATFRGKFAGIGDTWDGTNFVAPEPEQPTND
jgi:hypothetical protein